MQLINITNKNLYSPFEERKDFFSIMYITYGMQYFDEEVDCVYIFGFSLFFE